MPQKITPAAAKVVQQIISDSRVEVGSGYPWKGSGKEPRWDNPKSTKAYNHIESTHGPKKEPGDFWGRIAGSLKKQPLGQWYDVQDWVEAEKIVPKHPGRCVIDFKRPIGRVYHVDGTTITEKVTRAFVQRNSDGTLNSAYPVLDSFVL